MIRVEAGSGVHRRAEGGRFEVGEPYARPFGHRLTGATGVRDEHRRADGHRLDGDDPEVLDRREDEDAGALEQAGEERVGRRDDDPHVGGGLDRQRSEPSLVRAGSGDDDRATGGLACRDRDLEALVRHEPRRAEHEPVRHGLEEVPVAGVERIDLTDRGPDPLDVDRGSDDGGVDAPGARDALADELAHHRQVPQAGGVATVDAAEERCDGSHGCRLATLVELRGPEVPCRRVGVGELSLGCDTLHPGVVREQVRTDECPVVRADTRDVVTPHGGHHRQ